MLLLLCFLTYLSFYLIHLPFVFATTAAARFVGIVVQRIELGFGPRLIHWRWDRFEFELRLLSLGAGVKLLGMDDRSQGSDPLPGSYAAAPPSSRIFVALAGPIAHILLGIVLLLIPIQLEQRQLSVRAENAIEPRAVPELGLQDEPAHGHGQLELWHDTAGEFVLRLLTFRSLPEYGGYIGFIATSSAVALRSPGNWLTCLGLLVFTLGLVNLLPIPTTGGALASLALWEGLTGKRVKESTEYRFIICGVLFLLVIAMRLLWLDLAWLWSLMR